MKRAAIKINTNFIFLPLLIVSMPVEALNCRDLLQDSDISYINWNDMQQCLTEVYSESLPRNTSANIWRLIKSSFSGIENIPLEAYKYVGYTLTAIPLEELRNLSMERVEIVEAFGSIRSTDEIQGFSVEQNSLIAKKVRNEWIGKNPKTYSEYDLISMGEIICHLNVSDIHQLHADAFKNAAELIGNIINCPQDRLQALAKLAKQEDVFGEPGKWSKLDVSVIGNMINGLPPSDIRIIDKDKLSLNRYYSTRKRNSKSGETKNQFENGQDGKRNATN